MTDDEDMRLELAAVVHTTIQIWIRGSGSSAAPQQQQQQQQQSLETGPIVINAIIAVVSTSDDCRVVQEG